ncbi:hypothetical protein BO85DRAFT_251634 [Aspergillus piperis CBS 112811]|uniref:Secreted protein n=1 Tax=Aspergillus piperis CBS 112811 TaxID=1448313 RepID=A0A8G1R5Z9_9EURO|nr:hypothetical protein BO85DRAFT_251634 [Aspergillus piperis CBS 112811]RAH59852.1 hypothetical protein BO85DRAFT_251634 [Aspergillus piperis CBS 112811]
MKFLLLGSCGILIYGHARVIGIDCMPQVVNDNIHVSSSGLVDLHSRKLTKSATRYLLLCTLYEISELGILFQRRVEGSGKYASSRQNRPLSGRSDHRHSTLPPRGVRADRGLVLVVVDSARWMDGWIDR